MRRFITAAVFTAFALGSLASAQFSATISVDENGNGNFSNTNGFSQALNSYLQNDPGPGGLNNALTYDLLNPPGLVAGDLILTEQGVVSDVLRFNTTGGSSGGGSLVFYSDTSDGVDSLADIGFPTTLYTNTLAEEEVGPESGPNGFDYTPTAGQPGFVNGAAGPVTYDITSDPAAATPEPASAALMLAGLGLVAGGWRYSKSRRS